MNIRAEIWRIENEKHGIRTRRSRHPCSGRSNECRWPPEERGSYPERRWPPEERGPYPEHGPYPEKESPAGTGWGGSWTRLRNALADIVNLTNPDSPGIYEAITVEKINNLARNAFGIPDAARECWSHHEPKKMCEDNPVLRKVPLAEQALEKLSGDLSYNNVAAAKQILKEIVG